MSLKIVQDLILLLTGTTGTVGFAMLFCLHGKQLPVVAGGGALTCLVWLIALHLGVQSFFALLLASFFGSGYSALASRLLKVPKTVFLLAAVISLVPGRGLYQTMRYAVDGSWLLCFDSGIAMLSDILGIATGMVIVLIVERSILSLRRRLPRRQH